MKLTIANAGVRLNLEAPNADDLERAYSMLLTAPARLRELLAAMEEVDDDDDDDETDDTQGGSDPDGGGGMTADVDKLLAQVGISTE